MFRSVAVLGLSLAMSAAAFAQSSPAPMASGMMKSSTTKSSTMKGSKPGAMSSMKPTGMASPMK